jgi:hypothetical protein
MNRDAEQNGRPGLETVGSSRRYPDGMSDPRHNRWFRAMERHESTANAVSLWVFHMVGTLLVIVAMIFGMSSLLHLLGELGDGASDRIVGGLALLGSVVLFLIGRRLADDYRIHPRSH